MKTRFGLFALAVSTLFGQSANFSGVWKANHDKSKMNVPAGATYLAIIAQQDGKITEKIGVFGERGEQRSSFTYDTGKKYSMNTLRGLPMRTSVSWSGNTLVLNSQLAGPHPGTASEKWTLSPDGNTLTVDDTMSMNGRESQQTIVLEKQPQSAAEPLEKPEQTAGERFKNVQLLKALPSSQFLDAMRSFNMSLGVDCEFCHVRGQFNSDEKHTKVMARRMITMTHGINEQTFGGKMEVRCYTCHQGQSEPHSRPPFETKAGGGDE